MKYFSLLLVLIGIILFGVSLFFVTNTYTLLGSIMLSAYGIFILKTEKDSPNTTLQKDGELFVLIKILGSIFYITALLLLLMGIFGFFLRNSWGDFIFDHLKPLNYIICISMLLFLASYIFKNFDLKIEKKFKLHFQIFSYSTIILYYLLVIGILLLTFLFIQLTIEGRPTPRQNFISNPFGEEGILFYSKIFFSIFLILNIGKYLVDSMDYIEKKIE
jgi:hypothetical protein